jgi:hypothetical protein
MTCKPRHPHPEYVEAVEVKMDQILPGQAPVLPLICSGSDTRRVVVAVPEAESHTLYWGRLVVVDDSDAEPRKGCIEAMEGGLAMIRCLDWED